MIWTRHKVSSIFSVIDLLSLNVQGILLILPCDSLRNSLVLINDLALDHEPMINFICSPGNHSETDFKPESGPRHTDDTYYVLLSMVTWQLSENRDLMELSIIYDNTFGK